MDKDRRRDGRRDGVQSSSAASDKSSRLRMDSERNRSKPASPPRRKEIDNVMKKARRDGNDKSQYWNKKLLEVEEKDPNRWRHSGYKELYGDKSSSASKSRSRSPVAKRPPPKNSSRPRSPIGPSSSSRGRKSRSRSRSPIRSKAIRSSATANSRGRQSSPPSKYGGGRARSPSGSSDSVTSCSDDSCSVCSPNHGRKKPSQRSRSRSFSVPRSRPTNAKPATSSKTSSVNIGRKPPPKPNRLNRPIREKGSPPRDPRPTATVTPTKVRKDGPSPEKAPAKRKMLATVKIEGQKKPPAPESDSDDSSSSSDASGTGAPKMTLSERFGKMAQWSVDRRDIDYLKNMKITKESDSSHFKVVIDGPDDDEIYRPAAPEFSDRRVGAGYFPETMHAAPVGLSSWDDVRVRFQYYKGRGYLRDLSLDDYMKWEEWWYKYQEWLETERYYEHWASVHARSSKRRYRSKHSPID